MVTALTSLSLTWPIKLQTLTHNSARIDWTESRFRTCDSKSQPWLKVRSMSTKVPVKMISEAVREHFQVVGLEYIPGIDK
jgi:hypothetical protein